MGASFLTLIFDKMLFIAYQVWCFKTKIMVN